MGKSHTIHINPNKISGESHARAHSRFAIDKYLFVADVASSWPSLYAMIDLQPHINHATVCDAIRADRGASLLLNERNHFQVYE